MSFARGSRRGLVALAFGLVAGCKTDAPAESGKPAAAPTGAALGVDAAPTPIHDNDRKGDAALVGISPPNPFDMALGMPRIDAAPDGADAGAQAQRPAFLFVGSGFFSNGTPSIQSFRFDPSTAELQPVGSTTTPPWPTFAVFDPKAPRLYVTIENDPGKVAAFSIDPATGALAALGTVVPSGGNGSTHISIDRTGRTLFESHFGSGAVTTVRIGEDGAPGAVVDTKTWPVLMGTAGRIHSTAVHPNNRFVYAAGFWYDEIEQFILDEATSRLTPMTVSSVPSEPGAGPRVIEVHPNGRFAYVVNQGSGRGGKPNPRTVTVYSVDAAKGGLTLIQDIATGVTTGYQYQLQIAPNGKYVYVSAGPSLVQFAIDDATGKLTVSGSFPTGGKTTRHFSIDPSGRYLFSANLESDNLTVFSIDAQSGALTPNGAPVSVPKPTWVGLFRPR